MKVDLNQMRAERAIREAEFLRYETRRLAARRDRLAARHHGLLRAIQVFFDSKLLKRSDARTDVGPR
jgi:hypothetical protein